jgi:predicted  nucleic acid-binding Zn-ribbon protein
LRGLEAVMSIIASSNIAPNNIQPSAQLAQIRLPRWLGGRPDCPDPQSFYRESMNTVSNTDSFAELAQSYILQQNFQGASESLNSMDNEINKLRDGIEKFKDDWKKCGTSERLPIAITEIELQTNTLEEAMEELDDRTEDLRDSMISSAPADWEPITNIMNSISALMKVLFFLLNPSPSRGY